MATEAPIKVGTQVEVVNASGATRCDGVVRVWDGHSALVRLADGGGTMEFFHRRSGRLVAENGEFLSLK